MNNKEQLTLTYTEDFIVSCAVFRLLPEEVLANFMRLLKVDSYMLGTEDDTTYTANIAFTRYFKEKLYVMDKKHKHAYGKWSQILDAILADQDLEEDSRIKETNSMVILCYRDLSKKFNLINKTQLPGTGYINFNCNFVVLCFLHGINPVALLQDFINRISLARDFARNGSEESQNDPWMALMAGMSVDYFQEQDELHKIGFFDQHIEMDLLRKRMKGEPDYEKRLSAFNNCLKGMYNSFHSVPIKPTILSDHIS